MSITSRTQANNDILRLKELELANKREVKYYMNKIISSQNLLKQRHNNSLPEFGGKAVKNCERSRL